MGSQLLVSSVVEKCIYDYMSAIIYVCYDMVSCSSQVDISKGLFVSRIFLVFFLISHRCTTGAFYIFILKNEGLT